MADINLEMERIEAKVAEEYQAKQATLKRDAALGASVRELMNKDDDGLFMTRTYIRKIDAIRERIAQEQP